MSAKDLKDNGSDQDDKNPSAALSVQEAAKGKSPLKLQLQEHTKLPGHRPVETSHLRVVETFSAVGGSRPIVAGDMEVSSTLTISGRRPIAASHLHVSEIYVMGNRPIASNDIDDAGIMGYLD